VKLFSYHNKYNGKFLTAVSTVENFLPSSYNGDFPIVIIVVAIFVGYYNTERILHKGKCGGKTVGRLLSYKQVMLVW